MKRYLLLCLLALGTLIATAQTSSEHMKFMGIPMKGTAQAFVQKLQAKGMKILSKSENGSIILKGKFFNRSNCNIHIISSSKNKQVARIGVVFPFLETWESLSDLYFQIKNSLIQKYGAPSLSIETFENGEPSSNFLKLEAIKDGEGKYTTLFEMSEGYIDVEIQSITSFLTTSCYVQLLYVDRQNDSLRQSESSEDL